MGIREKNLEKLHEVKSKINGTKINGFRISCLWWQNAVIIVTASNYEFNEETGRIDDVLKIRISFDLDFENKSIYKMQIDGNPTDKKLISTIKKIQDKITNLMEKI